MNRILQAALAAAAALVPLSAGAVTLTDATVFSTNEVGNNWNSGMWNTQGQPADVPNRYNLYLSTTASPPTFINQGNDAGAEISIALTPGVYDFYVFGESVAAATIPQQHFVLNLYFDGNQSLADISGLYGSTCLTVCAASHENGLDLYGSSGAPEAGTLSYRGGTTTVTLTEFSWIYGPDVNEVWEHWAGAYFDYAPYGAPDFYGHFQLTVTATPVPLPAALPLLAAGLGGLGLLGRRRRR